MEQEVKKVHILSGAYCIIMCQRYPRLLIWCTYDAFNYLFWYSLLMSMHSIVSLCFDVWHHADPNRPGMHMKLIKFLLKLKAPRIVYVSCNPATCARDLNYLCHGMVCISFYDSFSFVGFKSYDDLLKIFCCADREKYKR